MKENNLVATLQFGLRPFAEACQRIAESIAKVGAFIEKHRGTLALVLPPGAEVKLLELRGRNGICIRHAGPVRGSGWAHGPRWFVQSKRTERVRTCRGSRR